MSWDTPTEKLLKSSRTFFARWEGARGHMRQLTVTHPSLSLVLSRGVEHQNLVISCSPIHITGPVHWQNARLSLCVVERINDTPLWRVLDEGVGLNILCESVGISEHVKLW